MFGHEQRMLAFGPWHFHSLSIVRLHARPTF
jgi:hypothetical protein